MRESTSSKRVKAVLYILYTAIVLCLLIANIFLSYSHIFRCALYCSAHILWFLRTNSLRGCTVLSSVICLKRSLLSHSLILHYCTVLLLMLSQCCLQLLTAIANDSSVIKKSKWFFARKRKILQSFSLAIANCSTITVCIYM